MKSKLEEILNLQIFENRLPEPTTQFKFLNNRKFKADFAWPNYKIIVEVEGGTWLGSKGGHTNGKGYENNCEKYNLATFEGWKVYRFTGKMVKSRKAIKFLKEVFKELSLV
jgi:very-short-patch-repair endonuclease